MSIQQTEVPRETLKQLLEKNGEGLFQDRDRCEGLLKDHCGSYRREISALVGALDERIPLELKSPWQSAMTPEAMRARLVQRLEENRGLAPEVAAWAVDTWSYALGVGLARTSDRVDDVPATVLPLVQPSGLSVAERVASDRTSGSAQVVDTPPQPPQTATKKRAGIGAVVALALAGAAFAYWHKPVPPPPPPPVHNDNGGSNGGTKGGTNGGSTTAAPMAAPTVAPTVAAMVAATAATVEQMAALTGATQRQRRNQRLR